METNYTNDFVQDQYRIWHEKLFNVTEVISNPVADFIGNCSLVGYKAHLVIIERNSRYQDGIAWLESFASKLLGSVILF